MARTLPARANVCFLFALVLSVTLLTSCAHHDLPANADPQQESAVTVGTTPAKTQPLAQYLTLSSELVPFQEIDVYAKEAGYVRDLYVDYGAHVHKGQLMAVLEIPELEAQLDQDRAAIRAQGNEVVHASHEVDRTKAQHAVVHLAYTRLAGVAAKQPGLVAQQEVDDAQGRDLALESQLEAQMGTYEVAQSQLVMAQAKLAHDQALYDYSKITAPFDGVITQRYANLGALMQAGTTSTQATPLVRLSQENLYRLVIPVPESYVKYIRIGDPVAVRVPSLDRSFPGKVARFSVELNGATRTMHTEVDVPNPSGQLVPGLYAEAVLTLDQKPNALVVPLQAVNREGENTTLFVVGPNGVLEDRPVTLGIQTANYAEVTSGLQQGDNVVVSDRSGLKAGEQVKAQTVQAMVYKSEEQ